MRHLLLAALMVVLSLPTSRLLAQQASTSADDARLQRILKRFPEADANKDGVLTGDEARAHWERTRGDQRPGPQRNQPAIPPTHADVKYGDHERQAVDLYLASADDPTPLVIFIHGGGFVGGDKKTVSSAMIKQMHDAGISVAAIHYRFVTTDPMPACYLDAARAVQFLRCHASEYNLDPTRFAATGGSAGAGISLWLAFHDDLADPASNDPIARQSTRLRGAAVSGAQVSYDPVDWRAMGLQRGLQHRSFPLMYGPGDGEDENTPRLRKLMQHCAPINHFDPSDPPVYMQYGVPNEITDSTPMNALIHHPIQGLTLKAKMDAAGVPCTVVFPGGTRPGQTSNEFLIKILRPNPS